MSFKLLDGCCKDCYYYALHKNNTDYAYGDCIRYPPTSQGQLPSVQEDFSCGEFKWASDGIQEAENKRRRR